MKNILLFVSLAILLVVTGFFVLNHYIYSQKQAPPAQNSKPYRATLTGQFDCLPHANKTGPQTLECAFGLKTDSGEYYSLDLNQLPQPHPEFAAGERFTATGTVTPIANLSSDHWRKYDIQGIFSVTDSFQRL